MLRRAIRFALLAASAVVLSGPVACGDAHGGGSIRTPRWQVFATRVPKLVAVDARSSSDVWAVGDGIVHWDGRTLRTTPLPWKNATLSGISAVSSSEVWAVGSLNSARPRVSQPHGIVLHWDGRRWRSVPIPKLPGFVALSDVTAASSNNVWIVGTQSVRTTRPDLGGGPGTNPNSGSVDRPLVMHWDGSRWRRPDVSRLVRECPWRDNRDWIWACGTGLTAINVAAPGGITAVGTEEAIDFAGFSSVTLRSHGRRWSALSPPPAKEGGGVAGSDVTSAENGDVFALDQFVDASSESEWRYRLVRWMGDRPHAFEYQTRGASVESLAALSSTNIWIVGRRWSGDGDRQLGPIVIHWNGRTASVQHTPFERYTHVTLYSVSAVSADDIWAVGNHLIARYAR